MYQSHHTITCGLHKDDDKQSLERRDARSRWLQTDRPIFTQDIYLNKFKNKVHTTPMILRRLATWQFGQTMVVVVGPSLVRALNSTRTTSMFIIITGICLLPARPTSMAFIRIIIMEVHFFNIFSFRQLMCRSWW